MNKSLSVHKARVGVGQICVHHQLLQHGTFSVCDCHGTKELIMQA